MTGQTLGALGSVLWDLGLRKGRDSQGRLTSSCTFAEGTQHRGVCPSKSPGKAVAPVV